MRISDWSSDVCSSDLTDYLVCTDQICVPEAADLATILTIGDGAIDPGVRARFDGWRQAIPKPIGSPATYQLADGRVRIAGPYPADAPNGRASCWERGCQ